MSHGNRKYPPFPSGPGPFTAAERAQIDRRDALVEKWRYLPAWFVNRIQYNSHAVARMGRGAAVASAWAGLLEAAQTYDPTRTSPVTGESVAFQTHAVYWMRRRLAVDAANDTTIHVPVSLQQPDFKGDGEHYRRYKAKYRSRVALALSVLNGMDLREVPDHRAEPEYSADDVANLNAKLAALPAELKNIIYRRYWLGHTLEAVSQQYHITKEAVRIREKRALKLLRREMGVAC